MYLSITTAVAVSGASFGVLSGSQSNLLNCGVSASISQQALAARQETTTPLALSTSVLFVTSVETILTTQSAISKSQSRDLAPTLSPSPSQPPAETSTATETRGASSTTATAVSESTSSLDQTSTSALSASTIPSPTMSTSVATSTQSVETPVGPNPWVNKGKIAGIVVGSVLGLLILSMIVYALYAASRGINVCNCFGGCCRKHDPDEENLSRLPSRSNDTYPYPDAVNPGPGTGYYRPPRGMKYEVAGPLPLMLPQQVAQERRTSRLQRNAGATPA
ncbi:hypothetical protein BDW02DRAFT_617551, partial [Decorospora gaudefroyi]